MPSEYSHNGINHIIYCMNRKTHYTLNYKVSAHTKLHTYTDHVDQTFWVVPIL